MAKMVSVFWGASQGYVHARDRKEIRWNRNTIRKSLAEGRQENTKIIKRGFRESAERERADCMLMENMRLLGQRRFWPREGFSVRFYG